MSDNYRTILVTGATGKQGQALVKSLLSTDATRQRYRILALTRNASSSSSRALLSLSSGQKYRLGSELSLVKGDLDDPASIRKVFEGAEGGIWGVFSVLAFPGLGANADGEEKQGTALASLSLEFGVSHFIYSSVERGGEAFDDQYTLDRAAKVKIERHIKSLSASGLKWTILRPGFFMENFEGTIGRITSAVLRCGLQPTTRTQLIAVEDIGHVAAAVFLDSERYRDKIIVVAGDAPTMKEQAEAYKRATGHHLPSTPDLLAKALLAFNIHTRGIVSDIERVHRDRTEIEGGHDRVLQEIREIYPGMMTFEDWARRQTKAKSERSRGWNGAGSAAAHGDPFANSSTLNHTSENAWNRITVLALIFGKR